MCIPHTTGAPRCTHGVVRYAATVLLATSRVTLKEKYIICPLFYLISPLSKKSEVLSLSTTLEEESTTALLRLLSYRLLAAPPSTVYRQWYFSATESSTLTVGLFTWLTIYSYTQKNCWTMRNI